MKILLKILVKIFAILSIIIIIFIAILTLLVGLDENTKKYKSGNDIPLDDTMRIWIPRAPLKDAINLKVTTNVDVNTMVFYFDLPIESAREFESNLKEQISKEDFEKYIKGKKIKIEDVWKLNDWNASSTLPLYGEYFVVKLKSKPDKIRYKIFTVYPR